MEEVCAGAGGGAGYSQSSDGVIIYIDIDMLYQRMNERVCLYVQQVDWILYTLQLPEEEESRAKELTGERVTERLSKRRKG
jgi:hypothetical protein